MRTDTGSAPARSRARAQKPAELHKHSLAEIAYWRLEEMIITLELQPGSLIKEADLSARLDIGRTPVREALKHLEKDGLIEIQPRRGIWIRPIDIRDELLALEVRRVLEGLIAGRAARRSTSAERERLAAMADDMEQAAAAGDDVMFMRIDNDFNRLIVQCARNPFADEAISALQIRSRRFWFSQVTRKADLVRAGDLHARIMRAVAAGDEQDAEQAAGRLLDYVEDFVRSSVTASL